VCYGVGLVDCHNDGLGGVVCEVLALMSLMAAESLVVVLVESCGHMMLKCTGLARGMVSGYRSLVQMVVSVRPLVLAGYLYPRIAVAVRPPQC